jgi:signal transduction histidine kinase
VKSLTVRKVLAFIGPYPYNPYLIFLFFWSIVLSRLLPLVTDQPSGTARWSAAGVVFLLSFIPPSLFAIAAYTAQKARNWRTPTLPRYIIEVAIGQSLGFIYAPFLHSILESRYGYDFQTISTINLRVFLAALIFVLLALALMHQAERKITERLNKANELVEHLKADREELINLDEAIRRQTSSFLHDRVQSDLMVVGIKLKSIQGTSSIEINDVIDKAISHLENTRSADLKNIIQVLSPNFEASGLKGSLESLIKQYESNMAITIQVDSASEELDSHYLLGAYRIVEQGLLNSLMHGPAKKALVSITTDAAGHSEIMISDDGPGADLDLVSSGVGTAVIDSWVSILNGIKTVDTVPGYGYRLQISFPKS